MKRSEYSKATNVQEDRHYAQTKTELFSEHITKFLEVKTEASCWPDDVPTEEEIAYYIRDFDAQESVLLEADKINKNTGLCQVAKLCQNSL